MRPLIGIPPCLDERGRWRPGREYHYAEAQTARSVAEAGGLPVYLPIQESVAELAERLDGLLLPGGDDFPPQRPYPPEVRFDPAPPRQIDFDGAILARCLERGLPVLGICYGMQLLALYAGGALHYDIPSDVPVAGVHAQPDGDARHPIQIVDRTLLGRVLGAGRLEVNSRHHQAVAEPGSARVTARAEDGIIEAIELGDERFVLGVQWHPEQLGGQHRARLFGAFVHACQEGDGRRSAGRG